jgi:tetratricopeptide (TPR) repeat protein
MRTRLSEGARFNLSSSWQMMATIICLCFFVTLLRVVSTAQDIQPKDGRYYESLARKAYQAKDYSSFLANMKMAAELRPNHPRLMYNLAVGYALTGQHAEALLWLGKVAAMGLVYPADKDEDFEALKGRGEFKTVLKTFEQNKAPLITSAPAFTIREKGLIPESVAYDPLSETFYLSSVYKRKILSLNKRGEVKDFADARDGLWSVMGMKVDAARRLLWVCTAAHPQMSGYREAENGDTALFKYDLRSGRLIRKYTLAHNPKPHWFGDLVINSRGDVFATDSLSPAIYVVRSGRDELELFLDGEPFSSLQGLDFTPDEKRLFVADYAKGIFVVELATRKIVNLAPAPDSTLLGIDGLYFYKGSLIGVQNGVNPQRLIRLFPSADLSRVERFEIIEANNPVFDEPTLGVLVKDMFYFIANSQWNLIDKNGQLAPADKLKEPAILKIRLRAKPATRRAANPRRLSKDSLSLAAPR